MDRKISPGVMAQSYARKQLLNNHREEYDKLYRSEMIRLGGTPKPTTEEKILLLQDQIEKLKKEIE
jgi:hypothetical protein